MEASTTAQLAVEESRDAAVVALMLVAAAARVLAGVVSPDRPVVAEAERQEAVVLLRLERPSWRVPLRRKRRPVRGKPVS